VALYGPSDRTTTKIAAGVILHDGAEPIMRRWVATDVTTNPFWRKGVTHTGLCLGVRRGSVVRAFRPPAPLISAATAVAACPG
jgi:hypothetical protein